MAENNQIEFQLVGIKTDEFATFVDEFSNNKEYVVNTNLSFSFYINEKIIGTHIKFIFTHNQNPLIVIAATCFFNILQWDKYFNNAANSFTIPKTFAQHIGVITVGTARGILHSKTEGTKFNGFIVPSINVLELVTNDIIIGGK
jgi:hypothetical protein